ncbi:MULTISPECIES: hypothetical protein [Paenibacillus]|uniref:Uncharacterized protein n=1 Tax=Paenibacillus elgii TaxID=189691 RepID=A0A163VQE4_9BACL|nr:MULTISPECIES: hypothetical protein [Paenibacillus]KZE75241.1 hypothetical protein AV654_26980 [Paenibacillus elgii]NEN86142.1 hypothetical protein [Paenibacillus elgii]GLI10210.1 hypothetical protein YDYSG_62430 [Paenibacillus tyrfis]
MKKSLLMLSAFTLLMSAAPISAFAKETATTPQNVQTGDAGLFSYKYYFELGTGLLTRFGKSGEFRPVSDELTLTVSQSSSGDTKVIYMLYEVEGIRETKVGDIVVTGNKTDEALEKKFHVNPDKQHIIAVANKSNNRTKVHVKVSP